LERCCTSRACATSPFFDAECCKGTELVEGWYWYSDDDENGVGGPYESEEAAAKAAFDGHSRVL
jgi:hypothetical protein